MLTFLLESVTFSPIITNVKGFPMFCSVWFKVCPNYACIGQNPEFFGVQIVPYDITSPSYMMQCGYLPLATKKIICTILIFHDGKKAEPCSMSLKVVMQFQRIET